ncbi:Pre-mRNA-splicing factor cwc15 [Talaromyces atroroseus]|uniref:Pre-mRNA-splicing factor cwc15 n=1 Tax=Talaromyces atroroseus TaxID=1441469 RepID=A0A225AJE1_TALAT|nr:Pre-mRNA-splicing factor cwc15 [Talaromyces atroroseus]OKL61611.1 Pre-mRNA-splicing factor cwc15 [Talaromyces atroroseus]
MRRRSTGLYYFLRIFDFTSLATTLNLSLGGIHISAEYDYSTSSHFRPVQAQGKEALRGPAYHQRLLPAYMHLKVRQPGQGGEADRPRDLRAELLAAEAAHFSKTKGVQAEAPAEPVPRLKRDLEEDAEANLDEEDIEAKRRRILEETRDIDADSVGSDSDSSDEDSDDEEDEAAELMRELEKIKRERQEQKEKEEREREAKEQEQREFDIARGNPLLNPQDFNMKRRWDDDVVFKNQARGSEVKKGPEFVNVELSDPLLQDLLRSDFHKRFMSRYVR